MRFLKFLRKIIIPKYMPELFKMPIIISLLVFLIASYVIAIPQSRYVSKNRYKILDEKNSYNFKFFESLNEDIIDSLKELNINVVNTYLGYNSDVIVDGEPMVFDYTKDNVNIHFYVVCDLYDDLGTDTPNYNIEERFVPLKNTNTDEYYLLVFYQSSLYFRTPELGINFGYLKDINIKFSDMKDGSYLSHKLMDFYILQIKYTYTFYTFIECLVLPMLIALISFIAYKNKGNYKSYKDYVNLAGLISIPLMLIIFILSWFLPNLMSYYIFIFSIYYLIDVIYLNKLR